MGRGRGCRLEGCWLVWGFCRARACTILPWTGNLVGVVSEIKDTLQPSPRQELELQGPASWVAPETRRKSFCLQHPGREEQGPEPVLGGRFPAPPSPTLACGMLHLEMRKTALGRPAMEQGGWGLAVQLGFEEQAEWKLTQVSPGILQSLWKMGAGLVWEPFLVEGL